MTNLKDLRKFTDKLKMLTGCSVSIEMTIWSFHHTNDPETKWNLSFVSQISGSKAQIYYFKTLKDLIFWANQSFNLKVVRDTFKGVADVS